MGGVMKKTTLSFNVLAAIIAVTILQACAKTAGFTQCATPTLEPPHKSGPRDAPITVIVTTTTKGANLRWTDNNSTPTPSYGNLIKAESGPAPTVFGRTLRAIAFEPGFSPSSVAVGEYPASN
jgi:hypothetical protein